LDLRRVFFLQLEIVGSTMGTRDELGAVLALCAGRGDPPRHRLRVRLLRVRRAFEDLAKGDVFGKIVLDHTK